MKSSAIRSAAVSSQKEVWKNLKPPWGNSVRIGHRTKNRSRYQWILTGALLMVHCITYYVFMKREKVSG